jgi:antitoxin component YwqK of YwqJK toxin-antitoxin module
MCFRREISRKQRGNNRYFEVYNMKRLFIAIVFLGPSIILNNLAFSDNSKDKNCDQSNCTECPQIFPDSGETDYNYKNGKLDGVQKTYYKNGKLFVESTYKNGKADGLKKLYYKDGQLWETQIYKEDVLLGSNNQPRNGIYKRFYKNGQLAAEGLYKDGFPQGEFKNYYENGVIEAFYSFVNKDEYSLKTYTKNGHIKFQGGYLNGQYDGKNVFYFDNGNPQTEMTFINGIPSGNTKEYFENGTLKQVYKYLDGYNKWEYVEYYENGKIKKSGTYSGMTPNVKAQGASKEFYENGKIKSEMFYKHDIPTGIRKDYAENGILMAEYKYPNGYNKWEYIFYYKNGKELSSGIYSGGYGNTEIKSDGAYKKYYENGQLKFEVTYKNNKKDGIQRKYFPDGALSSEITFKDGVNQTFLEIEKRDTDLLQEKERIQKVTNGMTTNEIFEKMKTVYKSLETYKAKGIVITTIDTGKGKDLFHTDFNMVLKKPNFYLISWTKQTRWKSDSGAVWDDGSHPYLYTEFSEAYQKMHNDEVALASATGISDGTAFTIPSIFLKVFKHDFAIIDQLINLKVDGEERINGESCYVISGSSKQSDNERIWISKSRFIILKYSRSFDSTKDNKLTDKGMERIINHIGVKATEEFKKEVREDMKKSQQTEIKGVFTQIYNDISFPELSSKDFQFKIPQGVVLRERYSS